MTRILCLLNIDNGLNDHCVGWAKRSVPNINNGIFIRWARYALPNLRFAQPTGRLLNRDPEVAPTRHFFGSGLSGLGFDNAHPVPHSGGRYVKPKAEADHWHRTKNDEGRPYTFVSAAQLLDDFFAGVERICVARGISTEVIDDKET